MQIPFPMQDGASCDVCVSTVIFRWTVWWRTSRLVSLWSISVGWRRNWSHSFCFDFKRYCSQRNHKVYVRMQEGGWCLCLLGVEPQCLWRWCSNDDGFSIQVSIMLRASAFHLWDLQLIFTYDLWHLCQELVVCFLQVLWFPSTGNVYRFGC